MSISRRVTGSRGARHRARGTDFQDLWRRQVMTENPYRLARDRRRSFRSAHAPQHPIALHKPTNLRVPVGRNRDDGLPLRGRALGSL
jgi:hypothetical protein